jgi:hypothetical protein
MGGFWAGTEPLLVLSAPTMQNGQVGFTFPTVVGRTYTVERKLGLDDPDWTPVETFTGTGGRIQFTRPVVANGMSFFRVRVD